MATGEALHDHRVPPELLELYEILEFQKAVETGGQKRAPKSKDGAESLIVSRAAWGARPPKSKASALAAQGTTGHWEGPHMGGFPHTSCATKVRGIQAFHMDSRGWADIAYTGLVCPHGYVFMGRGWNARTAANGTNDGNSKSYAFCYLGGENDPLTVEGKRGLKLAFDIARMNGGAGTKLWVHSDWKATGCPGPDVKAFIRSGLVVAPAPPPAPTNPPTGSLPRTWIGVVPTSTGKGYWEVCSDGAVHSYGDAALHFFGSAMNVTLHPIVAMLALPDDSGYYLIASDGGVFSFGAAIFHGSLANVPLNAPVTGGALAPKGDGYWLVGQDGGIFSFGSATYFGSASV